MCNDFCSSNPVTKYVVAELFKEAWIKVWKCWLLLVVLKNQEFVPLTPQTKIAPSLILKFSSESGAAKVHANKSVDTDKSQNNHH